MVESDAQVDMLAGLGLAIEAFEQSLDEYQIQFHTWSEDRRTLLSSEAAMAEERATTQVRELEERARELTCEQEALTQAKAELERFRVELDALAAECDRRERASREREDSLGQKYSSHEETAVSLQERTKQLDQRQCELQSRFEKIEQDLEERKDALTAAEKEFAEERKRFDHDHQELVTFRDELTRRESEQASQSAANKKTHQKLSQLSNELDARQKSLSIEGEGVAALRGQVKRRAAELSSLQAQLQARQTEIDTHARTLDKDVGLLKQQAEALAERERELKQTAAKSSAQHQVAAGDLERREHELADATRALSSRAEAAEADRREIEIQQQAAQAAALEHEQREQELADTQRRLAMRQATFKEAEDRLHAAEQALQAEREELVAKRESVEADLADKQQELARQDMESLARRDQVERDQKSVEQRARTLDEDVGLLKQQAEALAEREREFQQTAAKSSAQHQVAAGDLERREHELADATRALSSRAEAAEADRCEIETQQQAAQAAALEHEQREQVLAETQRQLAMHQATFKEAEDRLRAAEQALQAEREELAATRKSVEADLAAKRQESARQDTESLARRDQVERDQKSLEQLAQSLERRCEEIEQRSKTLAAREGELNGQQAKLEAALRSLTNDRAAVEKARSVVAEVDESRWIELNEVRAELNMMRTENELARARERKLEGSLGEVQAAHAREMHAAEDARTEAARLAEQLEDEKRTAAEQRAAIERREHEVLALLNEAEAKSAGSTVTPPDGGTLLVQRQASHKAVATFWADFKSSPSLVRDSNLAPVIDASGVSAGTEAVGFGLVAVVVPTAARPCPSGASELAGVGECATEVALDIQTSVMREELATARTEVEAAKHKEPAAVRSGPKAKAPSNGKKRKADNAPVKFTREITLTAAPELLAEQPVPMPVVRDANLPPDLDPVTANSLRMMRRLNPTKSDQELLAKISQEEMKPGKIKGKKGWFAFR